jgi:hippurate hydrolase
MMPTEELIALRRRFHQVPEVGMDLPQTQALILETLAPHRFEITLGRELSSVTAIVRGDLVDRRSSDVATLLVRSDMDALPIREDTDLAWKSTNGAMHACGHDCHLAIVLAAALEVESRRSELAVDVVFFFQPGEEGWGGAQLALKEGLLDVAGTRPKAALGLHVLAHLLDPGEFASREGAVLAGSTLLDVTFTGIGGHGSSPELARNPILAAAAFVGAIGTAIHNGTSMFAPSVCTFGEFHAGAARNIIPETASLSGVVRSFSIDDEAIVSSLVHRVATGIASANGVTVDIAERRDTIPTMTDARELAKLDAVAHARGETIRRLDAPIAISEDFSWILDEVPGVFLLVGARTSVEANPPSNHSSRATFSDDILRPTAELIVDWVLAAS